MRHKEHKTEPRSTAGAAVFVFLLCLLVRIPVSSAEIIDRVIGVVDGRIITLSDLRQERAIRAALGGTTPEGDRALLDDLIERSLMVGQLEEFPGVQVAEEEIVARLGKVANRQGLTEAVLREAIRLRLLIAGYLDLRFRQFIRISDEEVRKYYDEVFAPEVRARGASPPPFEQVAEGIRKNVTEEKLNRELDNWLEAVRRRSDVEILQ
jgi:hypothetical protein